MRRQNGLPAAVRRIWRLRLVPAPALRASRWLTRSTRCPYYESNVAPFGMVQIDGEQFTYFGKSIAANPTPANTLYGVQCAQNGTTRAAHSVGATVVPLNQFKPSYPWPVTPTVNTNDTTPSGTAATSRVGTWAMRPLPFPWPPESTRAPGARLMECQRQDREPVVL